MVAKKVVYEAPGDLEVSVADVARRFIWIGREADQLFANVRRGAARRLARASSRIRGDGYLDLDQFDGLPALLSSARFA